MGQDSLFNSISRRISNSLCSITTNLIYVLSSMNLYANLYAPSLLYPRRDGSSLSHQNFIFHLKRGSHDSFPLCSFSDHFFFLLWQRCYLCRWSCRLNQHVLSSLLICLFSLFLFSFFLYYFLFEIFFSCFPFDFLDKSTTEPPLGTSLSYAFHF